MVAAIGHETRPAPSDVCAGPAALVGTVILLKKAWLKMATALGIPTMSSTGRACYRPTGRRATSDEIVRLYQLRKPRMLSISWTAARRHVPIPSHVLRPATGLPVVVRKAQRASVTTSASAVSSRRTSPSPPRFCAALSSPKLGASVAVTLSMTSRSAAHTTLAPIKKVDVPLLVCVNQLPPRQRSVEAASAAAAGGPSIRPSVAPVNMRSGRYTGTKYCSPITCAKKSGPRARAVGNVFCCGGSSSAAPEHRAGHWRRRGGQQWDSLATSLADRGSRLCVGGGLHAQGKRTAHAIIILYAMRN